MNKAITDLIVVEYSQSQHHYHSHTISKMIFINHRIIAGYPGYGQTDYLAIGVFETEEEASAFIARHKELVKER